MVGRTVTASPLPLFAVGLASESENDDTPWAKISGGAARGGFKPIRINGDPRPRRPHLAAGRGSGRASSESPFLTEGGLNTPQAKNIPKNQKPNMPLNRSRRLADVHSQIAAADAGPALPAGGPAVEFATGELILGANRWVRGGAGARPSLGGQGPTRYARDPQGTYPFPKK